MLFCNSILPGMPAYARTLTVDISFTSDLLTLAIPGMEVNMGIIGNGKGRASMRFLHFIEILKCLKKNTFIIHVMENELRIEETSAQAETWLYQDDSILRKIRLPVNYRTLELLRLPMMGYTHDELFFNRLAHKVYHAEYRLEKDISSASGILKEYGITRKELDAWVRNRVYIVPQNA